MYMYNDIMKIKLENESAFLIKAGLFSEINNFIASLRRDINIIFFA